MPRTARQLSKTGIYHIIVRDRAFRIGQKKNVLVHKFITRGTIEEKIDLMIEEKIKMTQEIMPDMNESWITELDNRQLLDLFRLTI